MSALRSALSYARNPLVAGAAVAAIAGASLCLGAAPSFAGNNKGDQSVTICHAHASESNPYNVETVSDDSIISGVGGHGASGINDGDIIPPFDYDGGSYPGQNWDATGQAIWNNTCVVPSASSSSSTSEPAPSTSTSSSEPESSSSGSTSSSEPESLTSSSTSSSEPESLTSSSTSEPASSDPTTSEAAPSTSTSSSTSTEESAPSSSDAADPSEENVKITICHAHAADTNPYGKQTVDENSITGDDGHGMSGINADDIIPPFDYGDGQHYSGQNWDAPGQAIWNNGCAVPSEPTISNPAPSTSAATTEAAVEPTHVTPFIGDLDVICVDNTPQLENPPVDGDGIKYAVAGGTSPGEVMDVLASPAEGYVLDPAEGWTLEQDGTEMISVTVPAAPEGCGTPSSNPTTETSAPTTETSSNPAPSTSSEAGVDATSSSNDQASSSSQDLGVDAISTTTAAPAPLGVDAVSTHSLASTGASRMPHLIVGGALVVAAGAALLVAGRRPARRTH